MIVILVEDDAAVARATTRMIKSACPGADVEHVVRAADAIVEMQRTRVDAVVSDYDLVEGTGGDVLAWVRQHRPELVRRFVFFSGRLDVIEAIHDRCIQKGAPGASAQLRILLGSNPPGVP